MNKPKRIGTAAETAVARYLQANGWPSAERRALRGIKDAGDLTGTPGVCWSVKGGEAAKGASDADVQRWLAELDVQSGHARAAIGVLIMQRRGFSAVRAGSWWAVMPLVDFSYATNGSYTGLNASLDPAMPVRITLAHVVTILRAEGHGAPLEVPDGQS